MLAREIRGVTLTIARINMYVAMASQQVLTLGSEKDGKKRVSIQSPGTEE